MAINTNEIKTKLTADDQTKQAFQSAAQNANKFESGLLKMAGAFSIGTIAANLITKAVSSFSNFIKESTQGAMEDADSLRLLSARLENAGMSSNEAIPKVEAFTDSLINLGREDTVTRNSIGKLTQATGDLTKAMDLTKLASDLAASGFGDYASTTDMLIKVVQGRGERVLRQMGITMKENSTIAEQLAVIQTKVSRTTEQWTETTEGQIAIMQTRFGELKESMGLFGVWIKDVWARFINKAFEDLGLGGVKSFSENIIKGLNNIKVVGNGVLEQLGIISEKTMDERNAKIIQNTQNYIDALKGVTSKSSGLISEPFIDDLDDIEKATEEKAKKISDAYVQMSQKVSDSFKEQSSSIQDNINQLKELQNETEKAKMTAEERYQAELINMSKRANENAERISEQIKQEEQRKERGWEVRVAELVAEKNKELDIIKRAGQDVKNLNEEMAKDDLTVLREKHQKELLEIEQNSKAKEEQLKLENMQSQLNIAKTALLGMSPDYREQYISESSGFLSQIGQSKSQIVFNFNDVVAGDDGIKKIIEQTINRLNVESSLYYNSGLSNK